MKPNGLTDKVALITVNGISPGPCSTEINNALMENAELTQFFLSRIPVGRWGQPEEIGQLAVYICSEAAGFITGTTSSSTAAGPPNSATATFQRYPA